MRRLLVGCGVDDSGGIALFNTTVTRRGTQLVDELGGIDGVASIAIHPTGSALYVVGARALFTIALKTNGELRLVGRRPTGGANPSSVVVEPQGRFTLTTNYGSSTLVVHRIEKDLSVGALAAVRRHQGSGPVTGRQDASHLHQALIDPVNAHVIATDLGADRLYEYRLSRVGALAPVGEAVAPPGSGPRHMRHAHGMLLVVDELSSRLSRYRREPVGGRLVWTDSVRTTEAPPGPNFPSEVVLGGRRLTAYVGNRGVNSIGVVRIAAGGLSLIQEVDCGGMWPQHLAVAGRWLLCAARDSNLVTRLPIDRSTGLLGRAEWFADVASPRWISVLSS